MADFFPDRPNLDPRTALGILGVICLLVIPTGAVMYNQLDLLGPDEEIALRPADGPNGKYAEINDERQLTINVTDAGVNPDARTDIKRLFVISNVGDDEKQVWITHTNEHAVTFYDDSTGAPITEAENLMLAPNEQIVVSLRVDTTDPTVNAGETLVTKLFIHVRAPNRPRAAVDAPESIDFGNITVGRTTTTDAQIQNTGNVTLELSNLTIGGAGAAAFERADTGDLPSIQPGESETITLRFAPETPGAKSAMVEIETNAPATPTITINVTGTGVRPELTAVSGDAIDFGNVPTGSTAQETVTVRNDGSSPISVTAASLSGDSLSSFAVDDDALPVQLAPGETHEIGVRFAPTATGSADATLAIVGGGEPGETIKIDVRGRGVVTNLSVDPSAVDFGSIGNGTQANATLNITSTGTVPVSLEAFGVGGRHPDQFTVETEGVPEQLYPGETVPITVWFEPTQAGNLSAILTIDTNATASPTTTIALDGAGVLGEIGTDEDNLDFGNVTVDSKKTLNVTVWNEDDSLADLHVHDAYIVGANPEAFEITDGGAPFTLAPGETSDIQVTYEPNSTGIKTAQLRILSDAGNTPQIDIWMSNAGWRIRVQQIAPKSEGVDGGTEEWSMDPDIVTDDSLRVEVDADNVPEKMWLDLNVSQPSTRDAPAGMDEIRLRVERTGSFDMNFVHAKTPPTTESPTYQVFAGREIVQYITLWHSISNEDFSDPTLTYRVKRSPLPADVDPDEVEFKRYANGEWTTHEATLLRETTTHYVYRVALPGLSEFVITAPNGTSSDEEQPPSDEPDDDPETPPDDDDEGDSPETIVERGNVTLTFNGSDDTLQDVVSVQELPVPSPDSDDRDGPKAAIARDGGGAGPDSESIDVGGSGVTVRVSTDEQYVDHIHAKGADAMTVVDEPIPLTASHSLFSSKASIDDHWRMIQRVEITVPEEYEDQPATIRVKVARERFHATDPENATIARQHEGWQLLETRVVEQTAEDVILEADTPGFSVFAIFADNDVTYTWEVETEDESQSGVTIEPTFAETGIYNVSLTVTDAFGLTDQAGYRILANDVPTVDIEQGGPVVANESTTLVATVDDEYGNVTITWTFPDGSEATGRVVNYTFGIGSQAVLVVATDEFGAQETAERRFNTGGLGSLGVDAILRTFSLEGLFGLLILLLAALLVYRARDWLLVVLVGRHPPTITHLAEPIFEVHHQRVVIPRLELADRGGDLNTFEVSLLDSDGRVLATGSGSIDDGQEFEATRVVLRAASDAGFDPDDAYATSVVVTDDADNTTTERVPLPVDPFVYPAEEPVE